MSVRSCGMYVIMQEEVSMRGYSTRVVLCMALSVLLHGALAWALLALLCGMGSGRAPMSDAKKRPAQRVLQILTEPEAPRKEPPFAKTDPDQEEVAPLRPDFVGKHNAAESAAEFTPDRHNDDPLPSQNGEEKDELVTFDQSQQDGDLEHEGKRPQSPVTPAASAPPPAPEPPQPPVPSHDETLLPEKPVDGVATALPQPSVVEDGDVPIRKATDEKPELPAEVDTPVKVQLDAAPPAMMPSIHRLPVYDPSLADHMQQRPGFRTHERRSRSTGRFVIGRKASVNVASTPQGRYEEEIYRRIAYYWYIACDEHRGDIIPGSIVISLRINSSGLLQNMDLVRRTGASISQQSFTFAAIRRAALPPMPPAVRQEMVGSLLELIFQFNFD